LSLLLGLLASGSPCILPLYPGFLAYLAGTRGTAGRGAAGYLLGVFVLAGVMTMMLAIGFLLNLASISVGRALAVAVPFSDLVILALGGLLLFDRNPFKSLPQVRVPVFHHPLANAYLYGLLYGPITLPCSGAQVVGIFAFSFTLGEAASKLGVFFWFGLGFGLPLLALSLLTGAVQRRITSFFARHSKTFNLAAGILLIGVAVFDLANNWGNIVTYLQF
jgi:cytochrome c-type biogenesis protein